MGQGTRAGTFYKWWSFIIIICSIPFLLLLIITTKQSSLSSLYEAQGPLVELNRPLVEKRDLKQAVGGHAEQKILKQEPEGKVAPAGSRTMTSLLKPLADLVKIASGEELLPENASHTLVDRRDFNKLIRYNWPVGKPKGAIYFLIEGKRLSLLKKALSMLDRNYNTVYKYPIILFHEDNINATTRTYIRTFTKSLLFFQEIEMTLPRYNLISYLVPKKDVCVRRPVSYRHMCRFNAILIYKEPIFNHLEYYLRLDTDSEILRPIKYDIFKRMRDYRKVHGYIWMKYDGNRCVLGLWNATKTYVAENKIKAQFLDKWPNGRVYYNNFEVSRVDFWRSKEVQGYLDYIDKLGGIYYLRWGDNPIKALAVAVFLPKTKLHYFKDVGYKHDRLLVRH
ncbi:uncharacterized protein LOC135493866 [Lineus longissimus]|uniref:uncharacterized protein LOC135493866 n=1 Tax=Lineus longissimus TaxID=88925 RepID=UPI002B4CB612